MTDAVFSQAVAGTLLPKLLNGELEVPTAEAMAEEVK